VFLKSMEFSILKECIRDSGGIFFAPI